MTTLVAEANKVEEHEGGVMVVLDQTGDTRHYWDRGNEVEVKEMKKLFKRMTDKGYQAWSVTQKGDQDRKIREFDPEAEKIIFSPALVGG
jgi:hypothetical protein